MTLADTFNYKAKKTATQLLSCGLIFYANSLFHQQIKKQAAEIFDDLDLNLSISINIFISEKHN